MGSSPIALLEVRDVTLHFGGIVALDGASILRAPPHAIVRKGIARTFQNIQLFRTMSVLENVLVGAHGRGRRAGQKQAFEALDVVGLRERAHFPAAALPYGTQNRVEIARSTPKRSARHRNVSHGA